VARAARRRREEPRRFLPAHGGAAARLRRGGATRVELSAATLLRHAHRFALAPGRKVLLHVRRRADERRRRGVRLRARDGDGTAMAQGNPDASAVQFDGANQETTRDRSTPPRRGWRSASSRWPASAPTSRRVSTPRGDDSHAAGRRERAHLLAGLGVDHLS
jgi:hypothetical protein